jgi:hypothetical protein
VADYWWQDPEIYARYIEVTQMRQEFYVCEVVRAQQARDIYIDYYVGRAKREHAKKLASGDLDVTCCSSTFDNPRREKMPQTSRSKPEDANDFWDAVEKSAASVSHLPAWMKVGLEVDRTNFVTFTSDGVET